MYKKLIFPFVIAVVGFLIYSNTLSLPFIFDDIPYIVDNSKIKDMSNFLDISGTRYMGLLSFALNYYIDGLNPFGYHLANILIHIINGILVYSLVGLTFKTPGMIDQRPADKLPWLSTPSWIALITAIIFISHPIQTQAVTYITQRLASLTTLFYLLALVLYIKARLSSIKAEVKEDFIFSTSALIFYILSLIFIILAMRTKEISFTIPFIITLYEFTFITTGHQQLTYNKKRLLYLLPFLLTLPIIPFSRIDAGVGWAEVTRETTSRSEYLFTQFRVIVTYLRLLFLPVNQNLDYDYPIYHSFFEPQVYLSFFFLLSILGFAIYIFLRSRARGNGHGLLISFGFLWFFITLSIESSIIPLKNIIFEHRLYLPSVGAFISLSTALFYGLEWIGIRWLSEGSGQMIEDRKKRVFIFIFCFSLLISAFTVSLSIATYKRNLIWKDEYTLWKDTVAKSPNKARPHNNLGVAYKRKGLIEKGITEYIRALEINPDYSKAHNNLGMAYADQGRLDDAIDEYRVALRLKPGYAEAHSNLGNVYAKQGRLDNAINEYRVALRLKPDYAEVHSNLGNIYADRGRLDDAINEYRIALRLKPGYAEGHYNLGNVYADHGYLDDAVEEYLRALKLKPDYAEAHNNLGSAYAGQGSPNDAIREYKAALELKPEYVEAYNNLAISYLDDDRLSEAMSIVMTALSIDPSFVNAVNTLGEIHLRLGEFKKALREFERALEIEETTSGHWNAALASERLALKEKAAAHWQRYIILNPDGEDVEKVKEHLLEIEDR